MSKLGKIVPTFRDFPVGRTAVIFIKRGRGEVALRMIKRITEKEESEEETRVRCGCELKALPGEPLHGLSGPRLHCRRWCFVALPVAQGSALLWPDYHDY